MTEAKRSFIMSEPELRWYAVYTKPRWEKKVSRCLDEQGIENYCPVIRVVRQWSDRKKVVFEPVFKSYVFVRLAEMNKWDIKKTDGVLNFVYWQKKPAVIRDEEIEIIRLFLNDGDDVLVENYGAVAVDKQVIIRSGIFMNYKGVVVAVHANKATVRIDSMGVQLTARFDKKNLELMPA